LLLPLGRSVNVWFPGPTRVYPPVGISIGSAVSAGLTNVTNRQAHRPRYSVCSNRPHLAIVVMQPQTHPIRREENYKTDINNYTYTLKIRGRYILMLGPDSEAELVWHIDATMQCQEALVEEL